MTCPTCKPGVPCAVHRVFGKVDRAPSPRVMIESPFKGFRTRNVEYARLCLKDSLARGEAPFAMHLIYPQVLEDDNPEDRALGITCGIRWLTAADRVCLYLDLGITDGMHKAVAAAEKLGIKVERRHLPADVFRRFASCSVCFGSGRVESRQGSPCPYCKGMRDPFPTVPEGAAVHRGGKEGAKHPECIGCEGDGAECTTCEGDGK